MSNASEYGPGETLGGVSSFKQLPKQGGESAYGSSLSGTRPTPDRPARPTKARFGDPFSKGVKRNMPFVAQYHKGRIVTQSGLGP